jgi:hypothetical protein
MAGYSGTPLVAKLDIKPGVRMRLLGAPPGFQETLAQLPEGVTFVGPRARQVDWVLLFGATARELSRDFPRAAALLPAAGILWVAWPKQAAKLPTDLREDVVRRIGLQGGLVDVKVCAISDVWSGLKFVRRLRDR